MSSKGICINEAEPCNSVGGSAQLTRIITPENGKTLLSFPTAQMGRPALTQDLWWRTFCCQLSRKNSKSSPPLVPQFKIPLESKSSLTEDDSKLLPPEVVFNVFHVLKLSTEEQKGILHFLKCVQGISIVTMQDSWLYRFCQFNLPNGTLNKS